MRSAPMDRAWVNCMPQLAAPSLQLPWTCIAAVIGLRPENDVDDVAAPAAPGGSSPAPATAPTPPRKVRRVSPPVAGSTPSSHMRNLFGRGEPAEGRKV